MYKDSIRESLVLSFKPYVTGVSTETVFRK